MITRGLNEGTILLRGMAVEIVVRIIKYISKLTPKIMFKAKL
jgi:hypothetical protein